MSDPRIDDADAPRASNFSLPCGLHGPDVLDLDCPECEVEPLWQGDHRDPAIDELVARIRAGGEA